MTPSRPHPRLLPRPPRPRPAPGRRRARQAALGWSHRLAQRRLALLAPPRAQHADEPALARRRLRRSLPAAARARAGAPRRGPAPRRAGRHRLLLRWPTRRHEGRCLAVHGDRRRGRLAARCPTPSRPSSTLDAGRPGRRREDAGVAVLPTHAEAWRLLPQHLFDHPSAPGWATRSDSTTITSPGCASIVSHLPTRLGPIKRCVSGASDRRVAPARRRQFSFGLGSRAGTSLQDRPHDDR